MMSLGIIVDRLRACWSNLQAVFTEWLHRIRFRYELERLTERDLADMGMTRADAFNETRGSSRVWTKPILNSNLETTDVDADIALASEVGRC
jgi:uncharacterized protein YjiS (DUF1127 family)